SNYPLILVGGNSAGTYIAAGAERFSHANSLDQRVVELTDNVTFPVGRRLLTFGTHNAFIHFRNVFFPGSMGIWNFLNPDSLAAGRPNLYIRAVPGAFGPDGPVADFDVTQVGFYGEDRFSPVPNLTLTAGLRLDVPTLPRPRSTPLSTRASPFRRSEAGAWTHARRRAATSCGHRGWGSTTTWAVARRRSCGAASGYSAAGRRTCGCRMPMATRASSNRPYSAMVRRRRRTTG